MTLLDKIKKYYFFWAGAIIGLSFILGSFLKIQIEVIKKNNSKNTSTLTQVLPGFNSQSPEQLKPEIKNLKVKLAKLYGIFDPKEKWLKKDYDPSIYFVEELGKINQILKTKSVERQVNVPELKFKEKLPLEPEAFYLLSQLYGLKEVISLGMDYNINFKSINPLGIEELSGASGVKLAKSRIELTCPAQSLIEFILQLNEIVPRPCTESFSLKSQDSIFQIILTLNHIVIGLAGERAKEEFYASTEGLKEQSPETEQSFSRILRSNNPFFVPAQKEEPLSGQAQAAVKTEKPKQISRFLYRGKATLKSKEVVVIEDTLNQETIFLAQGEKIDNFILNKFSDDEAVLKNLDNGQETIIKRGE